MFNNVHAGSWFGLPDFGVTEAIGGLFGAPKTSQGGSNIIGPQNASAGPQYAQPANGGGYATFVNGGQNVIAKSPTSTGGSAAKSAPTSSGSNAPDPFLQIINDAYNSRIGDLNNQEGTLRSNQDSILGDISSSYDTSKGTLGTNLNQSNTQLDTAEQQGGKRQQDALVAARRLYNELIQGGQQRFGGASSAGEAYGALTGRELQRNDQQINTDYNTFMGQVSTARQTVKAKYDDAVAQLETQKNQALNQANRDFQDKLAQINSLRSQAAGDKASQQLSALQELRNQIYNINLQTAQNSQALNSFKTQAEQQLADATNAFGLSQQQANTGLQAFGENTSTNPNTGLTMNTGGASSSFTPTGAIGAGMNPKQNWYDQNMFA